MAESKRKRPEDGWWQENAAGRYIENVGISTSVNIPGLSDPNDKGGIDRWSGHAIFLGAEKDRWTGRIHDIAWSCKYEMRPGAEARCRTSTRKAVEALQAYYDKTGSRWEVLRQNSQYWMPRLPPKEEL